MDKLLLPHEIDLVLVNINRQLLSLTENRL